MNSRSMPYNNQNLNNDICPTNLKKIVRNILKLFNKTPKYEKYTVLSVVADIISKKELRKEDLNFQIQCIRLQKERLMKTV